jgi:uncharacterized iron-regulated protein
VTRRYLWAAIPLLALAAYVSSHPHPASTRFFDLASRETLSSDLLARSLTDRRIVLVGEHHADQAHHDGQLAVIAALHRNGRKVAIGLEMFRAESQAALDQWVAGRLSEQAFQKIYYDNWNFPWPLYGDILRYAQEQKIPLVGLNVPREITRQVARKGFGSLTREQKGQLPEVACRVDKAYMDYIRKAFGAHAHGQLNFAYFCEAQLVWDTAMAIHALTFLERHPEHVLVLLAGTGHARKGGIPDQLAKRSRYPLAVILPEVPGSLDSDSAERDDTDFLMLTEAAG